MAFQVKGKGKGGQWKEGYRGKSGQAGYGGYQKCRWRSDPMKGLGKKGGGKARPFTGKCYNCGREGQPARDCPDLGKGFKVA